MDTLRERISYIRERFAPRSSTADEVREFMERSFRRFPWRIIVSDWRGDTYVVGQNQPHFCGKPLHMVLETEAAGRDLLRLDGMRFLERFLAGEVDFRGNLYALASISRHASFQVKPWHLAARALELIAFQDVSRAQVSVKSHYDVPQAALDVYLDRRYKSYSCGIFEAPHDLNIADCLRIGQGREDDWDSLEKAQWRKFKDAIDYIAPEPQETVLDIGCGYGGQLEVALERYPVRKIVGWTHSHNQAREGRERLASFDPAIWELNEGDYRQEKRVFDHVTSTGMVSHVGPRGLVPYVKNVRKRIKKGGRYLHHALMTAHSRLPLDWSVGIAFNKKYVWPGFHWFTVGEHVRALEQNGFQIDRLVNLTFHYAKTTTAWYERMMANEALMREHLGAETFRAWQVFLAGITGAYLNRDVHVYRLYCVAV
ncbi:MAG: class I SAM-dependent methyltransferase [Enhygromyxa sp.]